MQPTTTTIIPIELLVQHPKQHEIYGTTVIEEDFSTNIKNFGILQPLRVMEQDGKYVVLSGHRRWAAAEQVGYKQLPCIVDEEMDDELQLAILISTNKTRTKTNTQLESEFLHFKQISCQIAETLIKAGSSKGDDTLGISDAKGLKIEAEKPFRQRKFIQDNTGISQRQQEYLTVISDDAYRTKELLKLKTQGVDEDTLNFAKAAWNDIRSDYRANIITAAEAEEGVRQLISSTRENAKEVKQVLKEQKPKTLPEGKEPFPPIKHSEKAIDKFLVGFLTDERASAMQSNKDALRVHLSFAIKSYVAQIR
jgi:hypothetical protein